MSIELLQGYTGCGKSYIAMTKVVDHLYEGGVVGLNFRLVDEWAYICALNHPKYKNGSASYEDCVKSLYKRCFYVGDVHTIAELSKMGFDLCEGWAKKRRERKTLVVVDEAQLYLNARNFRENFPWLQLGTQHRKMGLDFLLLAHHISMIDNQVEHLISYVSRAYNLYEQFRFPGTDLRFPWPFFFQFTRPRESHKARPRIIGFLKPRIYELYDSFELFAHDTLSSVVEPQGCIEESFARTFNAPAPRRREWPAWDAEKGRTWLNFLPSPA